MTAAIEARGGEILEAGRPSSQALGMEDLALRISRAGFKRVLFLDQPQGTQAEPDFATAKALANAAKLPLFMGGSLGTLDHVKQAANMPFLHGVLINARRVAAQAELLLSPTGQEA